MLVVKPLGLLALLLLVTITSYFVGQSRRLLCDVEGFANYGRTYTFDLETKKLVKLADLLHIKPLERIPPRDWIEKLEDSFEEGGLVPRQWPTFQYVTRCIDATYYINGGLVISMALIIWLLYADRALVPTCSYLVAGYVTGSTLSIAYVLGFLKVLQWVKSYGAERDFISSILNWLKVEPNIAPEVIRTMFNDLPFTRSNVFPNHTHGVTAADRSAASSFIDRLSHNLGLIPYFLAKSKSDERNCRAGSRAWYWSKDVSVKPEALSLGQRNMAVMIDTDYYVDMPHYLATLGMPTVLYTFQPDNVAKNTKEYSYTFDEGGTVKYNVSGGASYSHQVWNYSADDLIHCDTFLGIPYMTRTYLVNRRRTMDDHELVMVTPTGTWHGIGAALAYWTLSGTTIKRLHLNHSGFNRLAVRHPDGLFIATGRPNQYAVAKVPAEVDDTLVNMAVGCKYPLTVPQVTAMLKDDRIGAIALHAYLISKHPFRKLDVICPVGDGVRTYQYEPQRYDPTAKPVVREFMTPLISGAFAPAQTLENENQCISGRIERVKQPELMMTPFMARCMQEFAELFIPQPFELVPEDVDHVMDRQYRPTQRRLIALAEWILPQRVLKTFVKKEVYQNVKDPRMISTINTNDKVNYSRFIYAFEKLLKPCHWYAFSHTPIAIANRVVTVCQDATFVVASDFSRFDGHVSNLVRELERMLLIRAFHHNYHSELLELHRSQFGLKAFATMGSKYDSGYARASGSPETSIFNSITNAFVAYLGLRRTCVDGLPLNAIESWHRLGIYGGDDGLTADIDCAQYRRAASEVGQELATDVIRRGNTGVKFLARMYSPDVWYSCVDSCCDLPRQLSKLHVTVQLPSNVTPRMKLIEKARAFVLSDANTPILGAFCRKAMELSGSASYPKVAAAIQPYNTKYPEEKQYPNHPGEWMLVYAQQALPDFDFAGFDDWLRDVKNVDDLLRSPMRCEPIHPESKLPVVVDDVEYPIVPLVKERKASVPDGKYEIGCELPVPTVFSPRRLSPSPPLSVVGVNEQMRRPLLSFTRVHKVNESTTVSRPVRQPVTIRGSPPPRRNSDPGRRPWRKETWEELKARKMRAGTFDPRDRRARK